jgi:hypothetical protein
MKRKRQIWIAIYLVIGFAFIGILSCNKEELLPSRKNGELPTNDKVKKSLSDSACIITRIDSIADSSAICTIEIYGINPSSIDSLDISWGNSLSQINYHKMSIGSISNTKYSFKLSQLVHDTTYYLVARALISGKVIFVDTVSFQTIVVKLPVVSTVEIKYNSNDSAFCKSRILSNGGSSNYTSGVCWGTNPKPSFNDNIIKNYINSTNYTCGLSGFKPYTTYYVRAFVTNSAGTAYGNVLSFSTGRIKTPTITTLRVDSIGKNSAISGGQIISTGGGLISSKGICWSSRPRPTTSNNKSESLSTQNYYYCSMFGLRPSTKYYVRAYAKNAGGLVYGNEVSFTTKAK